MWKNININLSNIKTETARAVLIKCPHSSDYDGYVFWHPAKLVRTGRHGSSRSIGYNDDFEFKLLKYGNGKHNKFDVIDEETIGVEEFEEMFGVINDNITAKKVDNEHFLEVKEPEKINVEVSVKEELKNE